jgi:starch phosphorylase
MIPERLNALLAIATNLSWSWDPDARDLFARIDRPLWSVTRHNPLDLLHRTRVERLQELSRDQDFLALYDRVAERIARVSSAKTWFDTGFAALPQAPIAYFCAEFALHHSVPVYSGGLGVLAGDHLKAASDLGVPMVGVGLLYSRGYFDQKLRSDGWQEAAADEFDPGITALTPVAGPRGEPLLATVMAAGRVVHVGAWRLLVGRVQLFLLDTDLDQNDSRDREILHHLYPGRSDHRLLQEWILGVGGVRVLRALGIRPAGWHSNEGHAAFMLVERVRELVTAGTPFEDAVRQVRIQSLFTTHTPVPAGHDVFSRHQVVQCAGSYWRDVGAENSFFELGRHPTQHRDDFHMTVAAMRLSEHVNAVSLRHGEVTRHIWSCLWPDRPERVPITHVTNGVHLGTWMNRPVRRVLDHHLGADWPSRAHQPELWAGVDEIDDIALWAAHCYARQSLFRFIREEARRRWRLQWRDPAYLASAGVLLLPEALTIGFARRFTAYKRPDLIFHNPDQLRALLVNPERPVQVVFAGKAHPEDEEGKRLLQRVYSFTRDPAFEGRVAFLEDYELHLARRLVQGVDLWLNLPRPPLEASGTSGMKAALNGVPQLGTRDGWWAEGYTGSNGWILPDVPRGEGDAAEAAALYELLETQIVPLFFDRNPQGISRGWVSRMKHALAHAGQHFTAQRMVRDYACRFYVPMLEADLVEETAEGLPD